MDSQVRLSGFGQKNKIYSEVLRPDKLRMLTENFDRSNGQCVPRGGGQSYGNIAIAEKGITLIMTELDRIIDWAPDYSWIKVESGLEIGILLKKLIDKGVTLPVVPGTPYATIGGCVAMDVHGKNSYCQNSFGSHVKELQLLTERGMITCSPTLNSSLFWLTIGGFGCTGVIYSATIVTIPISSPFIEIKKHIRPSINSVIDFIRSMAPQNDFLYAWLDPMSQNRELGRGVVWTANYLKTDLGYQPTGFDLRPNIYVPKFPWNLSRMQSQVTSSAIWRVNSLTQNSHKISNLLDFHFPLARLYRYPRYYGKSGFFERHYVIPIDFAVDVIKQIVRLRIDNRVGAFFISLKIFGQDSQGVLSYFRRGLSLAIQIPRSVKSASMCKELNQLINSFGGQEYLAKTQEEHSLLQIKSNKYSKHIQNYLTKDYINLNSFFLQHLRK